MIPPGSPRLPLNLVSVDITTSYFPHPCTGSPTERSAPIFSLLLHFGPSALLCLAILND